MPARQRARVPGRSLAVAPLGVFVITLDALVVSVALPAIERDLGGGMTGLQAELFFAEILLHGGPAPVRRFLPELVDLIWQRRIEPGRVFDLERPVEQVAEGYRAMDERRAIKALVRP
jgi:threonine dehydrogenase-like Zn-dependent dehydrogenase